MLQIVRIAALALALVVVAQTPAGADPKAEATPHIAKADVDYKLGKFADALAEYSKAYELFKAPGLLFNIGQCHRNLKQFDKAVFFYEGYLRAAPDAPNKKLVQELLAESRAAAAQQAKDRASAESAQADEAEAARLAAQEKADAAARERALAESEKLDAARRAHEENRKKGHFYNKWWFWTGVAVTAAAIGGTAYYFSGETTYIQPMGTLGTLDRGQ